MTEAIEFPNATRLTVVRKDGTVTEEWRVFSGCEVHIQDEGRTVKIFPIQKER
jgi:hypothetical protein